MTNSMALSTVIDTSNIVNGQEGTKAEGNILDRFNKNLNKTSDYYYDN